MVIFLYYHLFHLLQGQLVDGCCCIGMTTKVFCAWAGLAAQKRQTLKFFKNRTKSGAGLGNMQLVQFKFQVRRKAA